MNRRDFLANAGLVSAWAMISVGIGGCYDDDPSAPADNAADGDSVGVVTGGGHSHGGAIVSAAELQEGGAVTLTLSGSGHTHTVQLSAVQVVAIADGDSVTLTSSSDAGHTHTVTFN
jgi:NAD(P)H-hydrate repair Nnr-like enzyme with NAD(P)H-hydrate epimerase domain